MEVSVFMKKVLIMGNGYSRLHETKYIQDWDGEVWGCNRASSETNKIPSISRVFTVHEYMYPILLKDRIASDFEIYGKTNKSNTPYVHICSCTLGYSSGSLAIIQALDEQYDKIVLVGFDFGGKDIYQSHLLIGDNFVNQFIWIREHYNMAPVYFLLESQEIPSRYINSVGSKIVFPKIAIVDYKDLSNYSFPEVYQRYLKKYFKDTPLKEGTETLFYLIICKEYEYILVKNAPLEFQTKKERYFFDSLILNKTLEVLTWDRK